LFRLDLAKEMLNVIEDGNEHFVLGHTECWGIGIAVGTVVYDAIHVQLVHQAFSPWVYLDVAHLDAYIEAIEFGYAILRNELRYRGVSFAHPSEELGDTHDGYIFRV
jgi:hypothetical protein